MPRSCKQPVTTQTLIDIPKGTTVEGLGIESPQVSDAFRRAHPVPATQGAA